MQMTKLGEAEIITYMSVYRAKTGKYEYYMVVDGKNVELTKEQYEEKINGSR